MKKKNVHGQFFDNLTVKDNSKIKKLNQIKRNKILNVN